jgi:hypothetical protein
MNEADLKARAAQLRDWADTLRMLAGRLRYDLRKQAQLYALADGFDRKAGQLEGPGKAQ